MSYILDALRKSETERRQGKAPDLGQQVQMVYQPRKKPVSAVVWVALALLVNAGVVAYVMWPARHVQAPVETRQSGAEAVPKPEVNETVVVDQPTPEPEAALPESGVRDDAQQALPASGFEEPVYEQPVVIVPSQPVPRDSVAPAQSQPQGRVPHLVELPLSFQKSVPDLIFNSHIYSSDPSASRVMINNRYLSAGQSFGQLTVERITDDGVVLSKNGQRFRVGVVRDWVSPN